MDHLYYRAQLNKKDARLYDRLYQKISARAGFFDVFAPLEKVRQVMKAVLQDHPELYWFEGKWKGGAIGWKNRCIPQYKDLQWQHQAAALAAQFRGAPIDQIKQVYDWILENVTYGASENDQTIFGALEQRRAVCKGIARTVQLLMNQLEIPCFLVEGTLDGKTHHIWNVIRLDGVFYHLDAAVGYPQFSFLFNGMDRPRQYPCFLVSDQTISKTHRIYESGLPCCPQDFDLDDYFVCRLEIPQAWRSPSPCYLDRGSTCVVMKAEKDVIKIAGGAAAMVEREKMVLLADAKGVARLKESIVQGERVYLRMPYYKPLRIRRKEADFDAIAMAKDLLGGLIACRERGIYHLDIQPKNIYFDEDGQALLADFGNAALEQDLPLLPPRRGTLAFMAPEVYERGEYSQASEIYALGIVLYSLLNGAKLPFTEAGSLDAALQKRMSGVPLPQPCGCSDALWKTLGKMIAFERAERFQTYEDCLRAL